MPAPHRSEDLSVHRFGRTDPDAPTLLLLHGLTDSGRCWPDAVERWRGDYRLVAWDARGHGESERFTPDELEAGVGETHFDDAVDLLEVLAEEGASRPILVGLSMGGGTAAAVAARRPELVRAVVLEDPVLGGGRFSDEHATEFAERRVRERQGALDDPATTLARGRREHPGWPETEYGPWGEAKQQTEVEVLRDLDTTVHTPWPEVAAAIEVPALVVLGSDGIWSPEMREQLVALGNDRLEIEEVDGAAHCVRRDRPDAFHSLVDPWIAKQLGA
jgi:pimeloyl-ACP methyl ester carboxylesterase